ncbi:Flp family type IVb pilin [Ornithinimicrobium sp. Y1694]|uniref:Flp family type IVb pilin n=1 Tax=Ornithinimicrobium sp. Y1694 TaxID=3418590 RepID=UPI003CE6A22C
MLYLSHVIVTLRDKLAAADKERGATAVEYGIMVAAIAVVVLIAAFALGDEVVALFEGITEDLGGRG